VERADSLHQPRLRLHPAVLSVMRAEDLIGSPPNLHGVDASGRPESWALAPESLRLLNSAIQPGAHTLETGAGVSTVLFAIHGTDHVCVAPDAAEVERIRSFCAANGISADRIEFVVEASEDALPRLELGELDLVLIDGSHSFPTVFIDFHYGASHLRAGGLLFVDDVNLWGPRVLRDFLCEETSWELEDEVPLQTAVFRKGKQAGGVPNWTDQPYVTARSYVGTPRRTMALIRQGRIGTLAQRGRRRVASRIRSRARRDAG
jgi:predicted O-methyltransferase YrrM